MLRCGEGLLRLSRQEGGVTPDGFGSLQTLDGSESSAESLVLFVSRFPFVADRLRSGFSLAGRMNAIAPSFRS